MIRTSSKARKAMEAMEDEDDEDEEKEEENKGEGDDQDGIIFYMKSKQLKYQHFLKSNIIFFQYMPLTTYYFNSPFPGDVTCEEDISSEIRCNR